MTTVYNKKNFDATKEFMFLGEALNIQRYDKQRYAKFENINRRMISLYWVPEEINMTQDQTDFQNLTDAEQHIYVSNLQYQILMDSVQGRSPTQVFSQMVSLPELEGCFITQGFFETIHSRSYSHMIRNIFNDPSEIFDKMGDIKEIIERSVSVTKNYDILYEKFQDYSAGGTTTLYEVKEALHDAVVSMNILEAVRFYVSFACNLSLDRQKVMKGSGNIITLIARDEAEHKNFTQHIFRYWKSGADDPDMKKICEEREHIRYQMFDDLIAEEKEWIKYLFKYGSMRGFNTNIASAYLEYMANKAMVGLGMEERYETKENPIPWINFYFKSDARQNAPQETENTAYLVGGLSNIGNKYEGARLG